MEILTRFYLAFESVHKYIVDLNKYDNHESLCVFIVHKCPEFSLPIEYRLPSPLGSWKTWKKVSLSTRRWKMCWATQMANSC